MKIVFRKVFFFSLAQITVVNGRYRHSNNKHTGNNHELIFVRNMGQKEKLAKIKISYKQSICIICSESSDAQGYSYWKSNKEVATRPYLSTNYIEVMSKYSISRYSKFQTCSKYQMA